MKETKPDDSHSSMSNTSVIASSEPASIDFKQLYSLYQQELCDYLRSRYAGSNFDPEDIVQTAFIKLAEIKDSGKIKNPRAFLFATVRNIAIDEFRKSKIRLTHKQDFLQSGDKEITDSFSPENVLLERQKLELINTVLKTLPKIQRSVLLLHRLDKLTYSQIASKYGLSETTVRRHVAGAIEKLHRGLKQAKRQARK